MGQNKLDAIDLIIRVLREHEENLNNLLNRLNMLVENLSILMMRLEYYYET